MQIISAYSLGRNKFIYNLSINTSNEWLTQNPIIPEGVLAYSSDTYDFKIGNGSTRYNELPLASTNDSVSECPDDGKTYVRINGQWCVIEDKVVTYPGYIISKNLFPVSLDTQWDARSISFMNISSASLLNNLIYVPSISKFIASSYATGDNLYYSENGLDWTAFSPAGRTWNTQITNLYFLPDKNIIITYNLANPSDFCMYVPDSSDILKVQDYYQYVSSKGSNYSVAETAYINNGRLFLLPNTSKLLEYNFQTSEFDSVNSSAQYSSLFYSKANNTYFALPYSTGVEFSRIVYYCSSSEPSTFASASSLRYGYRRNCIVQVNDVFYALVYDNTNTMYDIIAISDLSKDVIIKSYSLPSDVLSNNRIYKFGYLSGPELFYVINYDNIYLSKDLETWFNKEFPTGIYPAMTMYNNISTWLNLAYSDYTKSLCCIGSTYCGTLDISDIVNA